MKKINGKIDKPAYLGMSTLDISKTLTHEFWYGYIKPKYQGNAKLCYMDTDSFIIHIKTEDLYKDVADDVEKWFDIPNYREDDKTPLPRGTNRKEIYYYLIDGNSEHKKAKETKNTHWTLKWYARCL